MLSKLSLFVFIAFAVGMCEVPEYKHQRLIGEYTYEGESYQMVDATYETKSSGGSAFMLFKPGDDINNVRNAVAICTDTSLKDCRIQFGKQLRTASAAPREEGGMY